MSHGKVSVDILGDNSDLNEALTRSLDLLVDFSSAVSFGFARPALNTTVTAVNKLAEAYRTLQPLYQEQIESEIRLQSVLKATGESSGFSADQLQIYAEQMQNVIGVADHLILNTLAVQASFERIQGDNFQRAAEAAFDMSAVLGTNLTSSVIRVGRALEDPIRGMERLERISITFSQSQKDLIRTLTESNKLFEAQEVILEELENRFGGTAEAIGDTFGRQVEILGFQFRNLGEDIFSAAVPALIEVTKFLRLFADLIRETFNIISDDQGSIGSVFIAIGSAIGTAFSFAGEAIINLIALLGLLLARVSGDFTGTFEDMKDSVRNSFKEIFTSINDDVDGLFGAFDRFNDTSKGKSSAGQRTPLEQLAKDISAAAFKEDTIQEDQLDELKKQTRIMESDTVAVSGTTGFALG